VPGASAVLEQSRSSAYEQRDGPVDLLLGVVEVEGEAARTAMVAVSR
jgi:hypothetical protein